MLRVVAVCIGLLVLFPSVALALPTEVVYADLEHCDPLVVPQRVDELGIAPAFDEFPDELIAATSTFTELVACPADNPELVNTLVTMTNLTPTAWAEVWYVADPLVNIDVPMGTSISNYDGLVDGAPFGGLAGLAFRIDMVGINRPLVFEDKTPDGIFEPGETWQFIIDDYMNTAGLAAHLFDSFGVASPSVGGPPSSGSIIAVPVPEPETYVLFAVGAAILTITTRAKRPGR